MNIMKLWKGNKETEEAYFRWQEEQYLAEQEQIHLEQQGQGGEEE